jgi:LysM domain
MLCMVTHRKRKNTIKFIITCVNLIIFNYVLLYADKFQVKLDNLPVKADFINTSVNDDNLTAVRLDNVIIEDKAHGGNITYVIKRRDTLESIAQSVGTTVTNIRMANALPSDAEVKKNGTIVNKEGIALARLTISQLPGIVIAMDSTTSVREFAAQYNLNEEDIKALNNISDSKTILRDGDELFLAITEQAAIEKGILAAPVEDAPEPIDVVLAAKPDITKPGEPKAPATKPVTKPVAVATAKPTTKSKPKAQIVRAESNGIADYDE